MTYKSSIIIFTAWAVHLFSPSWAAATEKTVHFASHDQAGSTHVSILTVAPWEEYVDSLQPAFEMTAQKALDLALPTTSTEEEKILRAFGLALSIAGKSDTSSLTKTATSTTMATSSSSNMAGTTTTGATTIPTSSSSSSSGNTASDSNSTTGAENEASGDLGKVPAHSFTQSIPGLEINPADTAAKDPVLQYQAATAIFQEVKLLSHHLKDIAGREGYVPYLVRAQISVMPRAHHAPYDTYTTISFFAGRNLAEPKPGAISRRIAKDLTEAVSRTPNSKPDARQLIQDALDWNSNLQRELALRDSNRRESPIVLPILVTDHLEGRLHSRTTEDLKEFLLAAVALQSTAASANLALKSDKIRSLLANDLNSLLTVARISDNSLRVRFGAASDTVSSHAMVAQTHNVTFLVLVKEGQVNNPSCKDAPIHFQARTNFVDADTGAELPLPGFLAQAASARATLRRFEQRYGVKFAKLFWGSSSKQPRADLVDALYAAAFNDRLTFDAKVNALVADWGNVSSYGKLALMDSFWVEAVNSQAQFHWHTGQFEVPHLLFPELPSQSAIVFDDQKTKAKISLVGGRRLRKDEFEAALEFSVGSETVKLRPSRVTVSEGLDRVDLEFQSPALWGSSDSAPFVPACLNLVDLKLSTKKSHCAQEDNSLPTIALHYRGEAEAKPKPTSKSLQLELRASAEIVRASRKAEGTIAFQAARSDDGTKPLEGLYFLEIVGGNIIPGTVIAKPEGCLILAEVPKVSGPCSILLGLSNIPNPIKPNVTVTLKRQLGDAKDSGTPLSWLVIAHNRGI